MEAIPPEAVVSTQTQVNVEGLTIDNLGAIQKESGTQRTDAKMPEL